MAGASIEVRLADEAATARLGEDLAAAAAAGDVFALAGDLGAGKTTLARGFIRALAGDPDLDVPSPTFTLVQPYEARLPVHHYDLYRLADGAELDELGFDEAVADGVALVEWPERAGDRLPSTAVRIQLTPEGEGRLARIAGPDAAMARIGRSIDIRHFLGTAGAGEATRRFLLGDASARAYETIEAPGLPTRILMNSPRRPDGPPIRDGKPYSQIAHLAETVVPFVAVDRALRDAGYCAPAIHAQDLDRGFLLIEHLGDGGFLGDGAPVAERYVAAARLLADMHARTWPRRMPVAPGVTYELPPYDRAAMLIETELLTDWYLPAETGAQPTNAVRADYANAWTAVLDGIADAEQTLVLRDFHSPNIIWRPERSGFDRLGIIDFQDALWGPAAYDVASLAQDARVTIPEPLERTILDAYCAARSAAGQFDRPAFERAYAVMAAQRNAKILGIFVRLNVRDGKPGYLKHLPRIRDYFARSMRHEALRPVADFLQRNGLAGEAA